MARDPEHQNFTQKGASVTIAGRRYFMGKLTLGTLERCRDDIGICQGMLIERIQTKEEIGALRNVVIDGIATAYEIARKRGQTTETIDRAALRAAIDDADFDVTIKELSLAFFVAMTGNDDVSDGKPAKVEGETPGEAASSPT